MFITPNTGQTIGPRVLPFVQLIPALHKLYIVALLFIVVGVPQDISASDYAPAVKPVDWVFDSHPADIRDYLKSQFVFAKNKGLIPYIYVYSDKSKHCKSIRALMKRKDMKNAFSGTHIIMLSFFDLKKSIKSKRRSMSDFSPILSRISEDGGLIGEVMYPEQYLYYPLQTNVRELQKYTMKNKWSGLVPKPVFARMLKKYFETNN